MRAVVFFTLLTWTSVQCWLVHPDSILKNPFLCMGIQKDEHKPDYELAFTCVILADRIVMTHFDACPLVYTDKSKLFIESVTIGVGHRQNTPDNLKTVYTVDQMLRHPGFNKKHREYNRALCLLKLKGPPMLFNERVQKAVLPPQRKNITKTKRRMNDDEAKVFISTYGGPQTRLRETAVHSVMAYKDYDCHHYLNNFFHLKCRPGCSVGYQLPQFILGSPVMEGSHIVIGMLGKKYAGLCRTPFVVEISWLRDWIDQVIEEWTAAGLHES